MCQRKFVVPFLFCLSNFLLYPFVFSQKVSGTFSITEYGALGDGKTINTTAIQATIDYCSLKGGGTVIVPKGIFLTGSIFLKDKVNLLIEKDAVL
jgi:exo-poly-alpha-galacturonosidase